MSPENECDDQPISPRKNGERKNFEQEIKIYIRKTTKKICKEKKLIVFYFSKRRFHDNKILIFENIDNDKFHKCMTGEIYISF